MVSLSQKHNTYLILIIPLPYRPRLTSRTLRLSPLPLLPPLMLPPLLVAPLPLRRRLRRLRWAQRALFAVIGEFCHRRLRRALCTVFRCRHTQITPRSPHFRVRSVHSRNSGCGGLRSRGTNLKHTQARSAQRAFLPPRRMSESKEVVFGIA